MKRLWSLFIVTTLMLTTFGTLHPAKAETNLPTDTIPDEEIEFPTGDDVENYSFVQLSEPITQDYDRNNEVLLGYYEPAAQINSTVVTPMDNYREYDKWYVYDQGITKSWSYLSNPYFIMSIARGMSYEKSKEISATISGTFSKEIPNASLPAVKSAFNLNASGSKKVTEKIVLSGPGSGYSSRDFYYKKGRHTHKIKIVQEHRSNWDGVLWKKTFYGSVGKPAIKHYSVDRR
ncbi:hypothetical protein [Bacillus badius]|uniref:Uncharacterized protein n=1 Tax=Bacillus badius TaxID=1455 RepID=A0ABR5AQM3_BACBA|nr:hypothetical protein [Bacillus badius]KIL77045.1 hypothetical protein SD77_1797 [Bacillus badius]KZO00506.1 hypothetical protein A4244_15455 [Bacillus badius]MED4717875.1 hypothetical protein [Bacillus badius]OCS87132.1 hypothetical protein A6M11_15475 [Bacillus badius]OVE47037.1 hypothetical protein B1A98_18930 [Bacillus badius]